VPRLAIAGTFDVANFGDLLFPELARRELEARLGEVELVPYSYGAKHPPEWAYEVRPLERLPDEIAGFDLLLVGGGQLIRYDTDIANDYRPGDPDVHHPLGLWLTPTLLAAAAGVPAAWNAPGVSPGFPAWTRPLVSAAVDAADYVAVRDEPSAALLAAHSGRDEASGITVVPDSAFGVRRLLPDGESPALADWRRATGLSGPYAVLQPSPALRDHARAAQGFARAAHEAGLAVLELPISPVHGDRPGLLELGVKTVVPGAWPESWLLAEIVAGAEGVAGWSYHLSVVAAAAGVPVHRPKGPADGKYDALEPLDAVGTWDPARPEPPRFGREASAIGAIEDQVSAHWDAIASLARAEPRRPTQPLVGLVAELAQRMEELAGAARPRRP
jgi:hypothetical protein